MKKPSIKPGRKPLNRKLFTIHCLADVDEDEFISRQAYARGLTKSQVLLRAALEGNWRARLDNLRREQKDDKQFAFRRGE